MEQISLFDAIKDETEKSLLSNLLEQSRLYSAYEWLQIFNRTIREGARPLIILWPFCPVAFVYDLEDTAGELLPDAVQNALGQNLDNRRVGFREGV